MGSQVLRAESSLRSCSSRSVIRTPCGSWHAGSPEVHITSLKVEDIEAPSRRSPPWWKTSSTCRHVTNKAKELGPVRRRCRSSCPGPGITVRQGQAGGRVHEGCVSEEEGGRPRSAARFTWMIKVDPRLPPGFAREYRSPERRHGPQEYPEEVITKARAGTVSGRLGTLE